MRSNKKKRLSDGSTKRLCFAAATGALYAMLTFLLAPISFGASGALQFRVSEALTLLPVLTESAVPGLFVGCALANLLCGAPLPDIVIGSLATLLAALLTRRFRKNVWVAALMPVLVNGLMVGMMLALVYTEPVWYAMGTVALGELGACYLLGISLLRSLKGVGFIKSMN